MAGSSKKVKQQPRPTVGGSYTLDRSTGRWEPTDAVPVEAGPDQQTEPQS